MFCDSRLVCPRRTCKDLAHFDDTPRGGGRFPTSGVVKDAVMARYGGGTQNLESGLQAFPFELSLPYSTQSLTDVSFTHEPTLSQNGIGTGSGIGTHVFSAFGLYRLNRLIHRHQTWSSTCPIVGRVRISKDSLRNHVIKNPNRDTAFFTGF